MSAWVLASKRKPPSGKRVLVYCPARTWGPIVTGLWWDNKDSGGSPGWSIEDDSFGFRDRVTHWMTLPRKP